MRKINFTNYKVLLLYMALALLMRFFSFFPSVINHDESTYILIAKAIRAGNLYFVDIIDTKPIGIFLLFGFFQEVFGEAIPVIRIVTAIWIALTAFFLFKIHQTLGGKQSGPLASGMIYIFITSIFTFFGVSPNTEHFFNLFTVFAFWLILDKKYWYTYLIAGLSMGIGFMIKYVVLFDAFAIALYLAWLVYKKEFSIPQVLGKYILMGIGFCLPFAFTFYYYAAQGYGAKFLFHTFEVSGNYFIDPHWWQYFEYLGDTFLRFLPVTIWFFYCFFDRKFTSVNIKVLTAFWSAAILFIILFPGKFFGHYFIQFMLPFSLLAGNFFDTRRVFGKFWQKVFSPPIGYGLLGLLIAVNIYFQWNDYIKKNDGPKEVAAYLKPMLEEEDVIYTGTYHHIVYHLLDKEVPTPYVHRSLLWNMDNVNALEIDHHEEMRKILDQNPRFILIDKKTDINESLLKDVLEKDFTPIKNFGDGAQVYERKKEE